MRLALSAEKKLLMIELACCMPAAVQRSARGESWRSCRWLVTVVVGGACVNDESSMWTDLHTLATALQLGDNLWLPAADGAAAGWLPCHVAAGGLADLQDQVDCPGNTGAHFQSPELSCTPSMKCGTIMPGNILDVSFELISPDSPAVY